MLETLESAITDAKTESVFAHALRRVCDSEQLFEQLLSPANPNPNPNPNPKQQQKQQQKQQSLTPSPPKPSSKSPSSSSSSPRRVAAPPSERISKIPCQQLEQAAAAADHDDADASNNDSDPEAEKKNTAARMRAAILAKASLIRHADSAVEMCRALVGMTRDRAATATHFTTPEVRDQLVAVARQIFSGGSNAGGGGSPGGSGSGDSSSGRAVRWMTALIYNIALAGPAGQRLFSTAAVRDEIFVKGCARFVVHANANASATASDLSDLSETVENVCGALGKLALCDEGMAVFATPPIRELFARCASFVASPEAALWFSYGLASVARSVDGQRLLACDDIRDALIAISFEHVRTRESVEFFCKAVHNLSYRCRLGKKLFGSERLVMEAFAIVSEYVVHNNTAQWFCSALRSVSIEREGKLALAHPEMRDAFVAVSHHVASAEAAEHFFGVLVNVSATPEGATLLASDEAAKMAVLRVVAAATSLQSFDRFCALVFNIAMASSSSPGGESRRALAEDVRFRDALIEGSAFIASADATSTSAANANANANATVIAEATEDFFGAIAKLASFPEGRATFVAVPQTAQAILSLVPHVTTTGSASWLCQCLAALCSPPHSYYTASAATGSAAATAAAALRQFAVPEMRVALETAARVLVAERDALMCPVDATDAAVQHWCEAVERMTGVTTTTGTNAISSAPTAFSSAAPTLRDATIAVARIAHTPGAVLALSRALINASMMPALRAQVWVNTAVRDRIFLALAARATTPDSVDRLCAFVVNLTAVPGGDRLFHVPAVRGAFLQLAAHAQSNGAVDRLCAAAYNIATTDDARSMLFATDDGAFRDALCELASHVRGPDVVEDYVGAIARITTSSSESGAAAAAASRRRALYATSKVRTALLHVARQVRTAGSAEWWLAALRNLVCNDGTNDGDGTMVNMRGFATRGVRDALVAMRASVTADGPAGSFLAIVSQFLNCEQGRVLCGLQLPQAAASRIVVRGGGGGGDDDDDDHGSDDINTVTPSTARADAEATDCIRATVIRLGGIVRSRDSGMWWARCARSLDLVASLTASTSASAASVASAQKVEKFFDLFLAFCRASRCADVNSINSSNASIEQDITFCMRHLVSYFQANCERVFLPAPPQLNSGNNNNAVAQLQGHVAACRRLDERLQACCSDLTANLAALQPLAARMLAIVREHAAAAQAQLRSVLSNRDNVSTPPPARSHGPPTTANSPAAPLVSVSPPASSAPCTAPAGTAPINLGECDICCERQRNTALQCGHMCCDACGAKLRTCHICRTTIAQKIRLFV